MGWIDNYLLLVRETEPPREFHFWCAVAGLGHVLGRKVYLDQYLYKIYPCQTMVLLCSDSAVSRKGAAMNCIASLLKTLPPDYCKLIPARVSAATLLDELNRIDDNGEYVDSVGLILANELGTFFSREEGRKDIPTLVTDLNDAPEGVWRAPTRTYGNLTLNNPCLGMIAGVTRTGLAHEVPAAVRTAGFLGRCLIVDSDGADTPHSLTAPPPKFNVLRATLLKDLHQRLVTIKGPMTWSADGKAWYDAWYNAHFFQVKTIQQSEQTGWYGRKHVHLLRTAIILTASERNERVLRVDMLTRALDELTRLEHHATQALKEVGVHSEDQGRKDKLLALLARLASRNGSAWVPRRKLLQRAFRLYGKGGCALFGHDLDDFEQAGMMERRRNKQGECEEWRVCATAGHLLQSVPE